MNRILRGERGVVSIFGLCALGILMILSATMYAVSRNHTSLARRFLARDELRNAAENGVRSRRETLPLRFSRVRKEPRSCF